MNHPLNAFGALLTLLAVAMLAVSPSSRSTTVRQPPPATAPSAISQRWPGMNDVTVIPAASMVCGDPDVEIAPIEESLCELDSVDCRCGTEIANERLALLRRYRSPKSVRMTSARVRVAENTVAAFLEPAPLLDCLSHYDPVYDAVVYGVVQSTISQPQGRAEQSLAAPANLEGDLVATFRSVLARPRNTAALPRGGWPGWASWTSTITVACLWRGVVSGDLSTTDLRAAAAGFGNWVKSHADRLAAELALLGSRRTARVATAMEWEEYAELIDRACIGPDASALSAGTSDASKGVRSGNWLRHSAASTLYQLGSLLQAAGLELEQGGSQVTSSRRVP